MGANIYVLGSILSSFGPSTTQLTQKWKDLWLWGLIMDVNELIVVKGKDIKGKWKVGRGPVNQKEMASWNHKASSTALLKKQVKTDTWRSLSQW